MTDLMDITTQTLNRRQGWQRRSLTVEFSCPAHLVDSLEFCRKMGQEDNLKLALMNVISLFMRDASGWAGFQGGPDGPEPPVPGKIVHLRFGPDSPNRPSFTWIAEGGRDEPDAKPCLLMAGGLLYSNNEGWSIHT
jgi:hypothetical protein